MPSLFENRFLHSKEFYREISFYSLFKRPLMLVAFILLSLGFVLLFMNLISANSSSYEFTLTIGLLLVPLALLTALIINYIRIPNIRLKQELDMNFGVPYDETVVVNDLWISGFAANGTRKYAIQFGEIKKVVKTKHYFLLITKSRLICALKKDSFIKGNPDDFLLFLRSKGYRC